MEWALEFVLDDGSAWCFKSSCGTCPSGSGLSPAHGMISCTQSPTCLATKQGLVRKTTQQFPRFLRLYSKQIAASIRSVYVLHELTKFGPHPNLLPKRQKKGSKLCSQPLLSPTTPKTHKATLKSATAQRLQRPGSGVSGGL